MFKLEFDPNNKELAAALGYALTRYGLGESPAPDIITSTGEARRVGKKSELAAPYGDTSEKTDAEETVDTEAAFGSGKSAGIAADPDGSTDSTGSSATADGPVDKHGTPHNPQYCVSVSSQKPFYASGANKGQWKKKPGVDENAYNEWYAATMPLDEDEPKESTPVNTAAAFGGEAKQTTPAASGDVPKNSGDLMEYISERQTAGTLDQKLMADAYTATGVNINDLFGDSEAGAVAKLYAHLQTVSL